MTKYHCPIKVPLNHSEDIDRILFFYGLDWFGAVASNLANHRPVLTRQLLYYYPDLPKAFYLFIPLDEHEAMTLSELRTKILHVVDSYLFAYNCIHPDCKSNARGKGMRYTRDDLKKHVLSDGGRVQIHDPFKYAFDDRQVGYVHKMTDEESTCGRVLIEEKWKKFERELDNLIHSYAIISKRILRDKRSISKDSGQPMCDSGYPAMLVKKDEIKSIEDVKKGIKV